VSDVNFDDLINWIGAAAGLGTAAFGFVEAFKWTPIGVIGIGRVNKMLGAPGKKALASVYGEANVNHLLAGTFRKSTGDLGALLKNGLRVALTQSDHARELGRSFGQDGDALARAVEQLRSAAPAQLPAGAAPPPPPAIDARAILGKFELAVDARVDAAIAAADDTYAGAMRLIASVVAMLASLLTASILGIALSKALLVGLAAVPIAPIAKDLVSLLNSARDALRGRVATK
jgi:hypothetical protein